MVCCYISAFHSNTKLNGMFRECSVNMPSTFRENNKTQLFVRFSMFIVLLRRLLATRLSSGKQSLVAEGQKQPSLQLEKNLPRSSVPRYRLHPDPLIFPQQDLQEKSAISIETWLRPAAETTGDRARIISFSNDFSVF